MFKTQPKLLMDKFLKVFPLPRRSFSGGGDSHKKVAEMLVGKFKLDPRRQMWVWLKFKLTPTGDFCAVSVRTFVVNFFMHSTKRST